MNVSQLLTASLCCAAAVTAYGAAAADDGTAERRPIEHVVVTSHPLSAEGLALSSEILEGEELSRKLESSVGETVGREPGVHAASFGQAASRPVIHGLGGPRVRLMEDRIDALDASVTSADHAVTIEPFIADRIEVLKGPSTLLYGSGAIGGVVDVHTGRIPHDRSAGALSGRIEARLGDNGDRTTGAGRLDGHVGSIAWHLDGFTRESDPYEIPGFAESKALRERDAAGGEPALHDEPEGRLPGSDLQASGGAAGLSLVGERGFAGLALSRMTADYGLPGGHGHEHEHEPGEVEEHTGAPKVDLEQTRVDLEAGLVDPLPGFQSLNLRIGVNEYRHQEIEDGGMVATTFDNEAVEARLELTHLPVADWTGALGIQYTHRELAALGEEAFIEPVDTTALGVFWVGERSFAAFDLEGGARFETAEVDPRSTAGEQFDTGALSVGLILPFGQAWSLGLLADYASRAPIAEELYSFGPHLTTRSFELGDPGLDPERALSFSANLRYAGERWFVSGTAYYNDFSDFIYEAPTGEQRDGLPVFAYAQNDARFTGLDAEVRATVASWDAGSLTVNARFDTVDGELDVDGDENLPRIPATRYALGLGGQWGMLRGSVDHVWVDAQHDVADFELPTESYRDLRAFLGADLMLGGGSRATVFVQGRNLTDADQRQHTSFIKDLAPLPGRTVEAGVRLRF
jgi:iron complex outermembrane recepter protein